MRYSNDIPLLRSLDLQYQCSFHWILADSWYEAHSTLGVILSALNRNTWLTETNFNTTDFPCLLFEWGHSHNGFLVCWNCKFKSTNLLQHIVVSHFVQILTQALAIWCRYCFAGVNIHWARAWVLFYICTQFQFTIIHYMGFTLVKRHNSVARKQWPISFSSRFNFNILLWNVSEDLSLSLFSNLKKTMHYEDSGVLGHLHL